MSTEENLVVEDLLEKFDKTDAKILICVNENSRIDTMKISRQVSNRSRNSILIVNEKKKKLIEIKIILIKKK